MPIVPSQLTSNRMTAWDGRSSTQRQRYFRFVQAMWSICWIPDVIIAGAGVASVMAPLFNDLKTGLVEYLLYPRANEIPLHARYGDDAVFPEEPQCASSDAWRCRRHSEYTRTRVTLFGGASEGSRIKLRDGLGEQSPAPATLDLASTLGLPV